MINILTAYKTGLSESWNEKKMLFWLYGFNLIFAYILSMPVSIMLNKALQNTTAASDTLKAFDFTIFATIMNQYAKSLSFSRSLITIGLLYLIVNIFFAGGILKIFAGENKFQLSEFLEGCVEYFNRFLRLFLLSVVFLLLVFVLQLVISKFFNFLTKNASTEHLRSILLFLRIFLIGIMLAFVNMVFDYAKIMTVCNDFTAMYKTMKNAVKFVLIHLRKTSGLYTLFLITAILILIIYLLLESIISVNSAFMVVVFFILSQLYMLTRVWIRLSFFSGQYTFYCHANTAIPGMSKEMLDEAVSQYEDRSTRQKESN